MRKKLVVISHTAHQITPDGEVVGWGPTVNEINYLSQYWQEAVHVGCIENYSNNKSLLPYTSKNIKFVAIPTTGGKKWFQKLNIIWNIPVIISTVHQAVKNATEVQVRLPMGFGLFLFPYFYFRNKKKYTLWLKFALSWHQKSKSLGYNLQKKFCNSNLLNSKVTINGFYTNQPRHCITFENPCIANSFALKDDSIFISKHNKIKKTFIFVGRVNAEHKGIDLLIEILPKIRKYISKFIIVGNGDLLDSLLLSLDNLSISYESFLSLEQSKIIDLYQESNFILLPSRNEGFPKVIAEAMNYGCIPICTNVGSIGHYLNHEENGFVSDEVSAEGFLNVFNQAMNTSTEELQKIAKNNQKIAELFTFEAYYKKLETYIFKS